MYILRFAVSIIQMVLLVSEQVSPLIFKFYY